MAKPYTGAGEIVATDVVISMETRVRLVVRVPDALAKIGDDLPADFEPAIRKALADALVGLTAEGFTATYVAVEQFHDAES